MDINWDNLTPQQTQALHALNQDRVFLQKLLSLSSDLLFQLDLQSDIMHYHNAPSYVVNLPQQVEGYTAFLRQVTFVHPDDMEGLCAQVDAMRRGLVEPCIYRAYDTHGDLHWHKKEYSLRFNDEGVPIEAIGRCFDMQFQKDLEEQVNYDALTGCYRKKVFETMVSHYLDEFCHRPHALFLLDLDNFKAVNDNLGHQFGDMVLREVGEKLKNMFRNADYVGRIGGDEFMVFVKDASDMGILEAQAQQILAALDTTYRGINHAYRVTVSVGISLSPQDGTTFQTLYDNADLALYDAKNRGKGDYVFYDPLLSKGTMENTLPYDVASRALSQHFDYQVVAETFHLLFHANDMEHAVDRVLAVIGNRFGVSRAYVFENTPHNPSLYANTYEWCAQGILPEKEHLQEIELNQFLPLFSQANEDGIIYCNDFSMLKSPESREILECQGIQSFLHSYIRQGDHFTYAVGFDDCNQPRVWSPIEITTLMHVSKIIAQFLHYKSILHTVNIISQERLDVLNALNCCSYIIDVETHKLTYFNEFTQGLVPHIQVGNLCHSVLRGHDQECFDCPLKIMRQNKCSTTRTIIHAETLDVDMLATANLLPSFQGRESLFVSAVRVDDMPELRASFPQKITGIHCSLVDIHGLL